MSAESIVTLSITGFGVVAVIILYLFIRRLQRDLIVVPAEARAPLIRRLDNALWVVIAIDIFASSTMIVMSLLGPEMINEEVRWVLLCLTFGLLAAGIGHCIGVMREIVPVFRRHDPASREFIEGASETGTS